MVAAGTNNHGQCDLSDWSDIVSVCAGAAYTVGLRSDGIVLVEGINDRGQHEAQSWNNIEQIVSGIEHIVGVQSDGTLVAVGANDNVAIYDDGTVCAVGRSDRDRADVDYWKDIIAVSAYSHTVGLRSDGTVVASGDWDDGRCNVSAWSNIIDIDTGEKNTIGLEADGTVHVVGENEYDQSEIVKIVEFGEPIFFTRLTMTVPPGRSFGFETFFWLDNLHL